MRRAGATPTVLALLFVLPLAAGLAVVLAACGEEPGDSPAPAVTETVTVTASPTVTPTVDTGPATPMTVSLYFLRGEALGVAHRTVAGSTMPATAAVNSLLGGPDKREKAAGLDTTIPEGTTLNGVTIEDGTARVDLSDEYASGGGTLSMQARIAQVVYTLTQFRTVKRVEFLVDGEPVEALGGEGIVIDEPQRRAHWKGLLPAIFVETPAVGDRVSSPVTVKGTAMVFEATFQAEVLGPDGDVLASATVTATRGAPGRGTFGVEIAFDTPSPLRGALRVYEVSMEDGSRMNTVKIPLRFLVSD